MTENEIKKALSRIVEFMGSMSADQLGIFMVKILANIQGRELRTGYWCPFSYNYRGTINTLKCGVCLSPYWELQPYSLNCCARGYLVHAFCQADQDTRALIEYCHKSKKNLENVLWLMHDIDFGFDDPEQLKITGLQQILTVEPFKINTDKEKSKINLSMRDWENLYNMFQELGNAR